MLRWNERCSQTWIRAIVISTEKVQDHAAGQKEHERGVPIHSLHKSRPDHFVRSFATRFISMGEVLERICDWDDVHLRLFPANPMWWTRA